MQHKQVSTLNKNDILGFLSKNKKMLAQKFNVEQVALFGSYSRDEAREDSDIDIVITMTKKDFIKLFDFKEFLENHFHKTVNVTTFDGLRSFIKKHIEKDLIYA